MMDIYNQIIAALSTGLAELFPDIKSYPEWIPDKLPSCCFLIGFAGDVSAEEELGGRLNVSGKLDITYLPPNKSEDLKIRQETNSVFATLSLQLRVLRYQGLSIRLGTHTRHDDGDELHDLCDFTAFLRPVDNTPKINHITSKGEMK